MYGMIHRAVRQMVFDERICARFGIAWTRLDVHTQTDG